ncbi:hypothetical protein D3C76_808550 [compost metagenome]
MEKACAKLFLQRGEPTGNLHGRNIELAACRRQGAGGDDSKKHTQVSNKHHFILYG